MSCKPLKVRMAIDGAAYPMFEALGKHIYPPTINDLTSLSVLDKFLEDLSKSKKPGLIGLMKHVKVMSRFLSNNAEEEYVSCFELLQLSKAEFKNLVLNYCSFITELPKNLIDERKKGKVNVSALRILGTAYKNINYADYLLLEGGALNG